jgi:UDP-2,3-diacylglucosamine pyrophosphatase LpxH
MEFLGKEKKSFSKKIKNGVKSAVKYINKFEEVCADIAIAKNYDYVVCGHIHQPEIREMTTENGSVTYLNSGDWIENLTALEYHKSDWRIYTYKEEHYTVQDYEENKDAKALFNEMLLEFQKTTAQ